MERRRIFYSHCIGPESKARFRFDRIRAHLRNGGKDRGILPGQMPARRPGPRVPVLREIRLPILLLALS